MKNYPRPQTPQWNKGKTKSCPLAPFTLFFIPIHGNSYQKTACERGGRRGLAKICQRLCTIKWWVKWPCCVCVCCVCLGEEIVKVVACKCGRSKSDWCFLCRFGWNRERSTFPCLWEFKLNQNNNPEKLFSKWATKNFNIFPCNLCGNLDGASTALAPDSNSL